MLEITHQDLIVSTPKISFLTESKPFPNNFKTLQVRVKRKDRYPPQPPLVYVVRHAEYDGGYDDPLNTAGINRAQQFPIVMDAANLEVIFHTKKQRSLQTAQYLSCKNLIEYDPTNLDLLVQRIKADWIAKNVLIIGHTDTIPDTIKGLDPASPNITIRADEFSRLFVLSNANSNNSYKREQRYPPYPPPPTQINSVLSCNCAARFILQNKAGG
jgi:hypothetical protein